MRFNEQDGKNLKKYGELMYKLDETAARYCVSAHEAYFIKALAFVSAGIVDGKEPILLGNLFKGWQQCDVYLRSDGIRVNGRKQWVRVSAKKLLLRGLDSGYVQPEYVLNMLGNDDLLNCLKNLPMERIKDADRWGLAVSFLTDVRDVLQSYRAREGRGIDPGYRVLAPGPFTFLETPISLHTTMRPLELHFTPNFTTVRVTIGDMQGQFNHWQGGMALSKSVSNDTVNFILHDDNVQNLLAFLEQQVKASDIWMTQHMAKFTALHAKYSQIETVLLMKEKV